MLKNPKIGMRVKFTDIGLSNFNGLRTRQEIADEKEMSIAEIEVFIKDLDGQQIYLIKVDKDLINRKMITTFDLEEIEAS